MSDHRINVTNVINVYVCRQRDQQKETISNIIGTRTSQLVSTKIQFITVKLQFPAVVLNTMVTVFIGLTKTGFSIHRQLQLQRLQATLQICKCHVKKSPRNIVNVTYSIRDYERTCLIFFSESKRQATINCEYVDVKPIRCSKKYYQPDCIFWNNVYNGTGDVGDWPSVMTERRATCVS